MRRYNKKSMDYVLRALSDAGPSSEEELYHHILESRENFGELTEQMDQDTVSLCLKRWEGQKKIIMDDIRGIKRYSISEKQQSSTITDGGETDTSESVDEILFFTEKYAQDVIEMVTEIIPEEEFLELTEEQKHLLPNRKVGWIDDDKDVRVLMKNPDWLARGWEDGSVWLNRTRFKVFYGASEGPIPMRGLLIETMVHELVHFTNQKYSESEVCKKTLNWLEKQLPRGIFPFEPPEVKAYSVYFAREAIEEKL
jgi:hypothetical protein